MNPFNNLGFFPEVKSSFNYNDLINNTFHIIEKEENEENKNPVELPIFKYTIKKCLETFDTLNLKGFSPNHFSDIVQRHHKESDFKGHHDLLINAQLFELELFKLASLLLIVEEKDDINSSYKKQLINTIENVVRYNKVFNIDNTQFASKLYSHLYERHSKHHDIINQIRDTFLKTNVFFNNNEFFCLNNQQNIHYYNPVYLMAKYNDKEGLSKHLSTTKFSSLDYLNIDKYNVDSNSFYLNIPNQIENEVLTKIKNLPNHILIDEKGIILKGFLSGHPEFILPSKDICMLINFTLNNSDYSLKNIREVDEVKKMYLNSGFIISEEKEALLLSNCLHNKNPHFFKNWNWNAHDSFAIKSLLKLPKMNEFELNNNTSKYYTLIDKIKKQFEVFSKNLKEEEMYAISDDILKADSKNIVRHINNMNYNKMSIEDISNIIDLYFKPLKILTESITEQNILSKKNITLKSALEDIKPQIKNNPEIVSLIEKKFLEIILDDKKEVELKKQKRL